MNKSFVGRGLLFTILMGVAGALHGFTFSVKNTLEKELKLTIKWKDSKGVAQTKVVPLPPRAENAVFTTGFEVVHRIKNEYEFSIEAQAGLNLAIKIDFSTSALVPGTLWWNVRGAVDEKNAPMRVEPLAVYGLGGGFSKARLAPWLIKAAKQVVGGGVSVVIERL